MNAAAIAATMHPPFIRPGLQVEVVSDYATLLKLQPQWDELTEQTAIDHPFSQAKIIRQLYVPWTINLRARRRMRLGSPTVGHRRVALRKEPKRWLDAPRRAADAFERNGWRYLLARALGKLCAPVMEFGSVTFFVRELKTALPEGSAATDVQIRWASASEAGRLAERRVGAPVEAELRERFTRGHRCVVATGPDGKVAHTRWVARGPVYIPELDLTVMPGEGEAYFYDGYTWPEARGRGIDGAVRCFIFRTLSSAGLERVFSYTRGDNPPGVRAAERWQQPVGRLWYLRMRGFRPWVIWRDQFESPVLAKAEVLETDEQKKLDRAQVWHRWFESWLREPLAKRSTGYHALAEKHFIATADHISSTLGLDPNADFVLDVGCDSAMLSRFVAPRCRAFVGVDFIPGLLAGAPRDAVLSASGGPASFLAADGRNLPFRAGTFTKAYCSAVLHTLPSHTDGLRIIGELVRVCRPGGEILVASLPDTRKRFRARLEAWKQAGLKVKLMLAIWWAIPHPIKAILRRRLLRGRPAQLVFLEYDLRELKRKLENHGLTCEISDFPRNYWSRDFRLTRSNILIRIPAAAVPESHRGAGSSETETPAVGS